MLKVCLNGGLGRGQHAAVPITAVELAADALRSVTAGADAVHLHPRDDDGAETLAATHVAAAVSAVRAACPGIPVGVTTGAWIVPDPAARVASVRSWPVLPDFASVNAHEDGAEAVAAALHERGVGVEAGLWTLDAVAAYLRWRVPVRRILIECVRSEPAVALADAGAILAALPAERSPILLHAEDGAAWPVLRDAVRRGLHTRVGLEDTCRLPDGSPALGNADMVAAAVALGAG